MPVLTLRSGKNSTPRSSCAHLHGGWGHYGGGYRTRFKLLWRRWQGRWGRRR